MLKRIIIVFAFAAALITLLNIFCHESPILLFYDLKSGFRYHPQYAKKLVLLCGGIIVPVVLYLIGKKIGIKLEWEIRTGAHTIVIPLQKNSRFRRFFYAVCTAGCISLTGGWVIANHCAVNLWKGDLLIGHSFSGIDGYTYTGSREAFEEGYANGYRTFEVDIMFSGDGELILVHEWPQAALAAGHEEWNDCLPATEEFLNAPIYGKYTPLAFSDLLMIMEEYTDIWIVTDTKYADQESISREFTKLVNTAQELGYSDVLDRFVVQLYNEQMYEVVRGIYPFSSYIFTMYQRWWGEDYDDFNAICRWCVVHGINAITMPGTFSYEQAWEIAGDYGIAIYVHTINSAADAESFLDNGIKGLYTDFLKADELGGAK